VPLTDLVLRAVQTSRLVDPGDIVVVGVSGGPDSLCLLHILKLLAERYPFRLHAAHLNHGIRGSQAEADAEFVANLCSEWKISCTIENMDVPSLARARHLSLEEAARQARYAFLARVASQQGARVVVVGHHADDQVETLLMHLLRGSGLSGLRGMQPTSLLSADGPVGAAGSVGQPDESCLWLIRPLLRVTRAEIDGYCAENNQALPPGQKSTRATAQ